MQRKEIIFFYRTTRTLRIWNPKLLVTITLFLDFFLHKLLPTESREFFNLKIDLYNEIGGLTRAFG